MYYVTDVGAYTASSSYSGTFDQGGNVWEWNEAASSTRGVQGGSFDVDWRYLRADFGSTAVPSYEHYGIGFRVASVPEPAGTAAMVMVGASLMRRKRV